MNDDYLVDGTGTPDPEVVRLERLLGRLRSTTQPPVLVRLKPDTTETVYVDTTETAYVGSVGLQADRELHIGSARLPADRELHVGSVRLQADHELHIGSVRLQPDRTLYFGPRFLAPTLAAAAAVVLMVGLTWNAPGPASVADGAPNRSSWGVAVIVGSPRVDASVLTGDGRIAVGQTLTTDDRSRATIEVSDIGHVTVDEQTRIRLIDSRDGHHRLALDRGTLHAAIAAPPGQFVVNTPSATATDLGCVYSLHVNDDGSGLLSVEAGWVAFEERGRESFVPAGASSRTDRVNGPGTPRYDDTEPAFRAAIDDVDNGHDVRRKEASLRYVLDRARQRDAMTLWHLIPRVGADNRAAVVDALNARVPMPPAVSRDAVLRLDRESLDQWWDTLGLDQASWWRKWKVVP